MKLDEGQLRPGWVVEVLENGQIKANVPGLFTDADGTEVKNSVNYEKQTPVINQHVII